MNDLINKFLLAGDKISAEIQFGQSWFEYSV